MFDFFDAGIMEGLQHRLRQIAALTNGCNSITFNGQCTIRRTTFCGIRECFVQWSPREIISDEWLPESNEPYIKKVDIRRLKPAEKTKLESLFTTAYKLPSFPNLFERIIALKYDHQRPTVNENEDVDESDNEYNDDSNNSNDNDEDDEDDDDEDEDEEDNDCDNDTEETDAETSKTSSSSFQQLLTNVVQVNMFQRKKHSRKPQRHQINT